MSKILQKFTRIGTYTLLVLLSSTPLLFVPVLQDFYDTGKQYILIIIAIGSLALWASTHIRKTSHAHLTLSPAVYGFATLFVASLLSLINSSNKIEAIVHPFGPITFLSLTLILMIIPSLVTDHIRKFFAWSIYTVVSLLSILSIYQFFGLGKSLLQTASFLADPLWTPTGYSLSTITIALATLPLLVFEIRTALKEKHEAKTAISIVMTSIICVSLGLTLFQFIPKSRTSLLPLAEGWRIMLETLKNPKSAILGIGAENFLYAFSKGRSILYNVSPIWNIRYIASASSIFHMVTVFGLVGLVGFGMLFRSFLIKTESLYTSMSLWILAVSLLLTPPSISVYIFCALLMILAYHGHAKTVAIPVSKIPLLRFGITGVLVISSIASSYGFYRIAYAEYTFYSSLQSAKANNGTQTYNLQMKAIQLNKYISKYHIIYSQTNMALASSITSVLNQKDTKETPEQKTKDQQLIAQLIQQSIREAKLASALNMVNVLAWENLARIYNQLTSVAQGADDWTIASYKQAIALDPNNPILRLELGSVAMKQKKYADAISEFQKSIALKNNYANAYYNLAYGYNANGDVANAIKSLQTTLSLTAKSSSDYERVTKELEAITGK